MLGVEQIEERLDDYFQLLTGGARTTVPRHQALRATLDWSYELLSVAEQATLRRLAVFPDHFDIEAAVAVVSANASSPGATDDDGFTLMSLLVDKSLVVVHGDEKLRYRLLEPVREYAAARLAEVTETDEAHRRHREFFLTLSEGWARPSMSASGMRRLTIDRENFYAALKWSWKVRDIHAAVQRWWQFWATRG